ncbi:MAG: carbohydrate-binding protein [Methanospirillum sp.]
MTIRAIRITDRAWIRITASHVRVEDVLAEDDLHGYYPGMPQDMGANGAFFVWAENRVVEDIVFYRCVARNVGTHGFNMNGAGSPRMTRDIRFVECRAIRCGDADGHPWATGFDFHEENDLVNLTVERCYAADNWESGFHFEPGYRQEEITLVDCVSEENGWRNTNLGDFTVQPAVSAHFYMAGYTFAKGTHLVNCRSVRNRNYGFYNEQKGNNLLERCVDIGSGYGYKICKDVQDIALVDCISVDPANWAIRAVWTNNLRVEDFHQYNAPGRTDVSPRVQSMLGWYKGEPTYEKPVTNSHFEIAGHGSTLPILNLGDTYNPSDSGNTYDLTSADGSYVDPVQTPIPAGTSPPIPSFTPVPEATPPIPAVHAVPGRIEIENYLPGCGTGFSDTTAGNEGAIYRFDDVDIEYTAAIAGYDVGYIRLDEWLAYDIDASNGGRYAAAFRLACSYDGRSFQVEVDGAAAGRITVPKTAGFEAYTTAELPFDLAPGRHRLVVRFDQT